MVAKKSFHILKVGTPRIQENDTRTLGFLTLSIYGVPNKRYLKKSLKNHKNSDFKKLGVILKALDVRKQNIIT